MNVRHTSGWLGCKPGYRRHQMLQRLLPLVLAMVVGVAPIAREACLTSCADAQATDATPMHCPSMAAHETSGQKLSWHPMDNVDTVGQPSTKLVIDVSVLEAKCIASDHSPGTSPVSLGASSLTPVPIALRTPLRV